MTAARKLASLILSHLLKAGKSVLPRVGPRQVLLDPADPGRGWTKDLGCRWELGMTVYEDSPVPWGSQKEGDQNAEVLIQNVPFAEVSSSGMPPLAAGKASTWGQEPCYVVATPW